MAGYWVIRGSEIRDEKALKKYAELWTGIADRYGAEIIAGRGAVETREGPHFPRQLIVRFDSYRRAVDCYEDEQYRIAAEFARQAYDRELSILEG